MKIGITGHQTLAEEVEGLLAAALDNICQDVSSIVCVCCLAAGADQLAARTVVERGGSLEVVVPCADYESTFDTSGLESYRALLSLAKRVTQLPYPTPSDEAFLAGGLVVAERADVLVAVWDGEPSRGLGGTADVVEYARQLGLPVSVVWPEGATRA